MASDKTSFILYSDLISVVKKIVLKDREDNTNNSGELFLHILEYVNDNEPIPVNFIVEMVFEPIKLTLKRDLKKFEFYIEKQKSNGAKGGRPKKATETLITQPFISEPKKADSVSVSVSDTVSESVNVNEKSISNSSFKKILEKDQNKIKDYALEFKMTPEEVIIKLNEFYNRLEKISKYHPSQHEFTKHFYSWIPVNKVKNEPNSKNKSNSNTGYKPASVDREKLLRELAHDAANGNIPGDYSKVRTRSQA